ncbi:hypothetical protein TRAPUB_8421 [Trametes pubescens]|uniref:Uncharacterized protein n=1 Tax=Trametes pubescens TaxID=154538 RepID=A0A1M2W543_TRAPU|nr:hypothetical protein TRAPUB_8421 [Trametes pubescens]
MKGSQGSADIGRPVIDRYPDSRIAVCRLPHDITYPESLPFSETDRWFESNRTPNSDNIELAALAKE